MWESLITVGDVVWVVGGNVNLSVSRKKVEV